MAVFHHLVVKLNHTTLSPGTRTLIYSSRQAWQVYIQLLKSIMPWSASSTASPMLNCLTDEKHNAVSQQIDLPPGAASAFLSWQLMLTGQVLLCVKAIPFNQGGQSPWWSLRPEACSSFHWPVQMVKSHAMEFHPRGLMCLKHNALVFSCNVTENIFHLWSATLPF